MVRRPTGGRGVLHDDEVTYSVVAGVDDGIPRGTSASYDVLCGGLASAYSRLGVDAALTARPRGSSDSAACYLHATRADLSLGTAEALRVRAGLAGRHRAAARLVHDLPRSRPGGRGVSPGRRGGVSDSPRRPSRSRRRWARRPTRELVRAADRRRGSPRVSACRFERGALTDAELESAARLHAEIVCSSAGGTDAHRLKVEFSFRRTHARVLALQSDVDSR